MNVRFEEPISGRTLTLSNHQWKQTEGREYLERMLGATTHGVLYREKVTDGGEPVSQRLLRATFENTYETIEALRVFAWVAMRNAGRVKFYPDADDLGTYWWVDWQQTHDVLQVMDNHCTIELTLVEQPA